MDVASIINVIKNAQNAVQSATSYIQSFQQAGVTLTSQSEEEVEAEIAKLEAMLPDLRASTQEKLRGQ